MVLDSVDIRDLIPQKEPFVMVDRLSKADESSAVSVWEIRDDSLFVNGGELQPCVILENMAQTCAAHIGYLGKFINGNPEVKIGYIGSVKNLSVLKVPRVGDVVETHIRVVEQIMDMKLIEAVSYINGSVVAKAEIKIALTDKTAL
ncbi:MAG: pseudouridylate synthase [Bacteroidales bacterium]|nr:pseudouridylate synthase [Bacteroidales bacterium]